VRDREIPEQRARVRCYDCEVRVVALEGCEERVGDGVGGVAG
jgi:hypothetical protein